jgi:hypothetical protein
MKHASIVDQESKRLYRLRAYCLSDLDEAFFLELNSGDHASSLNGYCLDALEQSPRGSMSTCCGQPSQDFVSRGRTHAERVEREALADRLISEILAEEAGEAQAAGAN